MLCGISMVEYMMRSCGMLISYRELETQQCYGYLLQIRYAANKDNTIHKNIHTKPPPSTHYI